MNKITATTLKRAIVLLDAVGAQYAIIDSNGIKYGELAVQSKPQKKYLHGELTNYVRSNFKDLKIGEVISIEVDKYTTSELQKCISSFICKVYGKGTHTTCVSSDRKSIEILRVT
jgi:adenylyl- and sulfurtransferase ThiI